ncbi:hypothetical protein D3C74_488970 [compost metagenome]
MGSFKVRYKPDFADIHAGVHPLAAATPFGGAEETDFLVETQRIGGKAGLLHNLGDGVSSLLVLVHEKLLSRGIEGRSINITA